MLGRSKVTSLSAGWRPRTLMLERSLHRRSSLIHVCGNEPGQLVWQHVDDPDNAAASLIIGKDLHRGAARYETSSGLSVHEPARFVVDVDEQFARHPAVCKGHDACVSIEVTVDD